MKTILYTAIVVATTFTSFAAQAQVQLVNRPQDSNTEVTGPNNSLSVHDPNGGDAISNDQITAIELKHFDFKSKDCGGLEIKDTVGTKGHSECRKAGNGRLEWFVPVELDYTCHNTIPASNRRFILHWMPTGQPCTPDDYQTMRSTAYSQYGESIPALTTSEYVPPKDPHTDDGKKTAEDLNKILTDDPGAGDDIGNGTPSETPVLAVPDAPATPSDDARRTAEELNKALQSDPTQPKTIKTELKTSSVPTKPPRAAKFRVKVAKIAVRRATVLRAHEHIFYVDDRPVVHENNAVPTALLGLGLSLAGDSRMGGWGDHMGDRMHEGGRMMMMH